MNVNTGEVLGMVSLPDGEHGVPDDGADPRRNRMAQDVYELGSVFKIFAFAHGAGQSAPSSSTKRFRSAGATRSAATPSTMPRRCRPICRRAMCWANPRISAPPRSCCARAARCRGPSWTRSGCFSAVNSQLPERAAPLYPSNWGDIETATIGFGQGISVTPLVLRRAPPRKWSMAGAAIPPTFLRHPEDARGDAAHFAGDQRKDARPCCAMS